MNFHIEDWFPVILSLRVAILVVIMVAALGLPLSRFMARNEFYGKDVLWHFDLNLELNIDNQIIVLWGPSVVGG